MLGAEDRKTLLSLARETVAAAARGDRLPEPRNPNGALLAKGAVFISLHVGGELRGCIGQLLATLPLWESAREMAEAAATRDTRFRPIRPQDLPGLEIEVSLLSPMTPIRAEDVVVGLHGLYLSSEHASGLLLPQVPVEAGWDREEFLRRVHEKAGLPPGSPGTRLSSFTVEHFKG